MVSYLSDREPHNQDKISLVTYVTSKYIGMNLLVKRNQQNPIHDGGINTFRGAVEVLNGFRTVIFVRAPITPSGV